MFGGLSIRSSWLFAAQGAGRGVVTIVDVETGEVVRRIPVCDEEGRRVFAGGLAVGPTFTIHVADPLRRVVRIYSLFGHAVGRIGEPHVSRLPAPDHRGGLAEPIAVAIDDAGALYVASAGGPRVYAVQKRARDGRYLGSFRSFGVAGETFSSPRAIAVDGDRVFVVDSGNAAIQVFRRNGSFVHAFSTAAGPGERSLPVGLAVEHGGDLLVLERGDRPGLRRFRQGGELREIVEVDGGIAGAVAVASASDGRFFALDHDGDRLRAFDARGALRADLSGVLESRAEAGVPFPATYRRSP
ncbi:MAG TPA: hypothetical protein VKE69_06140 [Planctomycetota bacterium]|nr:hypothetical protein [Planctomycetota bacterium]